MLLHDGSNPPHRYERRLDEPCPGPTTTNTWLVVLDLSISEAYTMLIPANALELLQQTHSVRQIYIMVLPSKTLLCI
jgi:hypothetical protein